METTTTRKPKPQFTTRAFMRSNLSQPRGRGTWAFQATKTDMAFEGERSGDVVFAPMAMSLSEAKAWMHTQGRTGLWAILP